VSTTPSEPRWLIGTKGSAPPEDQALFRERALKEAVHELGHTYGLQHCPNLRCVMHFSNSLRDTDAKQAKWCSRCATQVRDLTGRT
jgi:archaemetzincin